MKKSNNYCNENICRCPWFLYTLTPLFLFRIMPILNILNLYTRFSCKLPGHLSWSGRMGCLKGRILYLPWKTANLTLPSRKWFMLLIWEFLQELFGFTSPKWIFIGGFNFNKPIKSTYYLIIIGGFNRFIEKLFGFVWMLLGSE